MTFSEATTPEWTSARVEDRLRKAVALRSRLSDIGADFEPTAEGIGIIGVIAVGADAVAGDPTGDDAVVAEAVEALSWLRWLHRDDAEIVLVRLEGAPWKLICFRFGISRPTADRRYRYALALIAWRLNGNAASRRTPSLRSMLGMRRAA
jgi:hypothetical protein